MNKFLVGQEVKVRGKKGTYKVMAAYLVEIDTYYTLKAFDGFLVREDKLQEAVDELQIDKDIVWERMQVKIKLRLSSRAYHTWITPCLAKSIDCEGMVLSVPDDTFVSWLSSMYIRMLEDAYQDVCGWPGRIDFETGGHDESANLNQS